MEEVEASHCQIFMQFGFAAVILSDVHPGVQNLTA